MLTAGPADKATLAFITPAHNQLAHAAAAAYTRQLTDPQAGPIPFVPLILEHAFAAIATAGRLDHARALHRRYADFWLVDGELDVAAATAPAPVPTTVPSARTITNIPSAPTRPLRRNQARATRPFVKRVAHAA